VKRRIPGFACRALVLRLKTEFTRLSKQIVIHLSWFVDTKNATVHGTRVDAANVEIDGPSDRKRNSH
jgi:hypothetical protein